MPVFCLPCDLRFADRKTLDRHILVHHTSQENRSGGLCPACGLTFTRSDNLQRHIRKNHPDYSFEKLKSSHLNDGGAQGSQDRRTAPSITASSSKPRANNPSPPTPAVESQGENESSEINKNPKRNSAGDVERSEGVRPVSNSRESGP